jgi:hypothetical protein
MPFAARRQYNNLLELHASRFGKPEYPQLREPFAQQPRTFRQPILRDHKKQDTSRLQPPISVLQKHEFQSLVITCARFPIVGRIQVKQRQRFRWAAHLHRVRLQRLDVQGSRPFRTIGIDLNTIAASRCIPKQMSERHPIANAGIER